MLKFLTHWLPDGRLEKHPLRTSIKSENLNIVPNSSFLGGMRSLECLAFGYGKIHCKCFELDSEVVN